MTDASISTDTVAEAIRKLRLQIDVRKSRYWTPGMSFSADIGLVETLIEACSAAEPAARWQPPPNTPEEFALLRKCITAAEYIDNGDPLKDVMDREDIEGAIRLLLKFEQQLTDMVCGGPMGSPPPTKVDEQDRDFAARYQKYDDEWCYEHGHKEHKRGSPACQLATDKAAGT